MCSRCGADTRARVTDFLEDCTWGHVDCAQARLQAWRAVRKLGVCAVPSRRIKPLTSAPTPAMRLQAVESDSKLRLWSSFASNSIVGLLFRAGGGMPDLEHPLGACCGGPWSGAQLPPGPF